MHGFRYPVEFWPSLKHLAFSGGTLPQNEIADYLVRDKATVARLLKRMEKQGLVIRTSDEQDARQKLVHITPAGQDAFASIGDSVLKLHGQAISGIREEDLETCLDVLDHVFINLISSTPQTLLSNPQSLNHE